MFLVFATSFACVAYSALAVVAFMGARGKRFEIGSPFSLRRCVIALALLLAANLGCYSILYEAGYSNQAILAALTFRHIQIKDALVQYGLVFNYVLVAAVVLAPTIANRDV